ncbi:MAG: hypothetical protein QF376_02625 [Anaerolineales bacterium]|nr:hypothetical protein [Anaerolineales bacterium]HJO32580.1 hypothetical protein [Anaerolineales bacterium]
MQIVTHLQQATAFRAGVNHPIEGILSGAATDAGEMGVVFHQIAFVVSAAMQPRRIVPFSGWALRASQRVFLRG